MLMNRKNANLVSTIYFCIQEGEFSIHAFYTKT